MALTQFELSRSYWDFAFENPDKVSTTHAALFLFAVEHCNRLGWKQKFGLPTSMALEALGLKSYNTYKKHFEDLVLWGFIKVHEYSKNQYSSNVIALSTASSKNNKALDKALAKHVSKQSESTIQSTGSIDKPITNNQLTITATPATKPISDKEEILKNRRIAFVETLQPFLAEYGRDMLNEFYDHWTEPNKTLTKLKFEMQDTWDVGRRLKKWANNSFSFKNRKNDTAPPPPSPSSGAKPIHELLAQRTKQ